MYITSIIICYNPPLRFPWRIRSDIFNEMERIDRLADRIRKLVTLRRMPRSDRKIGITIFNFPPNSGAMGSAAHLNVFRSVLNTLTALKKAGYVVDVPPSVEALREALLVGNSERYGAEANVHATFRLMTTSRGSPI